MSHIYRKTIEIGLDCSPATMVSNSLIPLQEVKVTHGGGVGGVNIEYYCTSIDRSNKDFYTLLLFNGQKIEVNPRYIVYITPVNSVKLVMDITGHDNLDEFLKVPNHRTLRTIFLLLPFDTNYRFTPKSRKNYNDLGLKRISLTIEMV